MTDAIILAAGRGSRLGPNTEAQPKCLVEFGERPLIQWQCNALRLSGIGRIVVVTGYRHDMLSSYGDARVHNPDWDRTNMVASLLCAAHTVTGPTIVSYSDIVYEPRIIEALTNDTHALSVAFDPDWLAQWRERFDEPLSDAETFRCANDGRICEIGRRAETLREIEGQYMGLIRITPESLEQMRTAAERLANPKLDMTSLLRTMIDGGYPVFGVSAPGMWWEIDRPRDLEAAIRCALPSLAAYTPGAS